METWKIVILIVVFILCALGAWYVAKLKLKEFKSRLYVYPKNGHYYELLFRCRMKCPTSGEWVDAVIYQDTKSGNYYARKSSDFFAKFVNYKDFDINGYNE